LRRPKRALLLTAPIVPKAEQPTRRPVAA
jgi:hypothetical protein